MARQALGPYDLLERIGVGGLGEVYRARRRQDGAFVSLKRIMPSLGADPDVQRALSEEADLVRRLRHPSIAALVDRGEVSGVHFIAYEYVPGRDLRAVFARSRERGAPVPLDVVVHVGLSIGGALAHAYDQPGEGDAPLRLVHRDISPTNILLSTDGDVKLIDFGIARAAGRASRTGAGEIRGTASYMSPEQVGGRPLDGRSDLFSLGVVLWELCAGERLFEGRPLEAMDKIQRGQIAPPSSRRPDLPPRLDEILVKMLAHSPDQRYARAAELHGELFRFAEESDRVTDRGRVAVYLRELFPEVAALDAASREESLDMADDKGGSDLDVFEGLAKRSNRPSALTPPPPSNRQGTLIGGVGPASGRGPLSGRPSGPPPSKAPPAPLPPPSKKSGASTLHGVGSLPPVTPPPRSSSAPAPLPPPSKRPTSRSSSGISSPSMPGLPPPSMPPASASLGSQLGFGKQAAPQSTRAGASIDMDWDDEEESTHVYDKQKHDLPPRSVRPAAGAPPSKVGAAAALLASSGGTAAPAARAIPQPSPTIPSPAAIPPTPSAPARPLPPPSVPASRPPTSGSVPARARPSEEVTDIRRRPERPSSGSKLPAVLAALALLGVIGLAVFMFLPRNGDFKIEVKAKDGEAVAKAEIFVDGVKVCDTTPCVARDLSAGPKTIKVIAPGVPASDPVTETIEAGKEKLVVIEIGASSDAAETGTGFVADAKQKGIKVFVDGKDRGTLPVTLNDLEPGSRKVKFVADERYEPLEKTIEVEEGELAELGEIKLKVLKGDLVLDLKTEDAVVTLIGEGAKSVEKRLPDRLWKSPPVKLEDLDADQKWTILAKKKGFQDFEKTIAFEDGEAEQTLVIELTPEGAEPVAATGPAPGPGPAVGPGPGPGVKPPPPPPPPPAGGNGTLNINSIPVSKVLLDGRPLGSTPKVGVSVPPGAHTVTFIHPEKGRKSVSVNVAAGKTATAAVKF